MKEIAWFVRCQKASVLKGLVRVRLFASTHLFGESTSYNLT